MSRPVRVVSAIVAIQAALIGIYWLVEHRRSPDAATRSELSTAPPEQVDGSMRPLSLTRRDGSRLELRAPDRLTLVHFWATWCPPCRAELPALLALPDEHSLDVVAVALDEEWSTVERFLDGRPLLSVYLGDSRKIQAVLGARSLPVTYLVQPGGRLQLRFDGARDWADRAFLNDWMEDIGSE
jgi:thiol-disulfide isomerase/thioredoxin